MKKNIVRKYYLADLYVIDCTTKDDNDISTSVEDRLKPIGKFIVCPNINGGYFEKITGKSVGSLDLNLLEYDGYTDGIDYPNIFVDDNSLIRITRDEMDKYLENEYITKDNNELESYLERLTILNGMFPFRRSYYKARIVTLKDEYDEAFESNKDYEKYVISHGNYIVRKAEHGQYVELLTGKKFGSYGAGMVTLHVDPHYYVFRTFSKTNPTLFVDKDGASIISNNQLYDAVKEYTTMNTKEELDEVFRKAKEGQVDTPDSFILEMKMNQKDGEKE